MKYLSILILPFFFWQCANEIKPQTDKYTPPEIDFSSPDNLVKSYWSYRMWQDTSYTRDTSNLIFFTSPVRKKLVNKYEKAKMELTENHYMQKNVIEKVSIETESRVVILTKEKYFDTQEGFSDRVYHLIKENGQWKIDEIREECELCKGTGKRKDILSGYPYRDKSCEYCEGLGWKNIINIYH